MVIREAMKCLTYAQIADVIYSTMMNVSSVAQCLFMKIKRLRKKKILPMNQNRKNKIAIDYLRQIQDQYDKEGKDKTSHIGTQIGAHMNSLELMVIEAKLLTGQLNATDDLLVALEEFIIKQI